MECRKYQSQIDLYLGGMLPADEFDAFTEHIANCQNCRDKVNSNKCINEIIKECDIFVPRIDVKKAVMEKIRSEYKVVRRPENEKAAGIGRQRFSSLLQDLVAAAAAAMIIFWLSGPVMARTDLPQYSAKVTNVSSSVGVVFETYLNFYHRAMDKYSQSIEEIDRLNQKGVEGL